MLHVYSMNVSHLYSLVEERSNWVISYAYTYIYRVISLDLHFVGSIVHMHEYMYMYVLHV